MNQPNKYPYYSCNSCSVTSKLYEMQPVIRFENVGKLYRLGTVGTGTLAHDIQRWWITSVMRKEDPYLQIGETNDRSTKGHSDYVYALKDINLEVQEGDVLGIIGKNGAGKSTLLKLLSRVTAPTTGKIYTKGRIASLLEVGTGFHPELTGRENIYMNGSILGMKKHEIDRKLDEIIDFSGCERYIDTPVKRYSSGMMVRLGFAVAAHLDPEILVVDEVLAVGDAEFQKKAIGKMQDVSKGQGRTVLFVSHNMDAIRKLCPTSIILENGKLSFYGSTTKALDKYLGDGQQFNSTIVSHISDEKHFIHINSVIFNGTTNDNITIDDNQTSIIISISGNTDKDIDAEIAFSLMSKTGHIMAALDEGNLIGKKQKIKAGPFKIERIVILPKYLFSGTYILSIGLHNPGIEVYARFINCALVHITGYFSIYGKTLDSDIYGFMGLETLP